MNEILVIVIGYLLGSVSFSYIITHLFKGVDIRKHGTKNAGATNVFLVVGTFAGILTLIGDIVKGTVAVLLAQFLFMPEYIVILAGISAIIGHCFSIFLKFKGGKGMATTIGMFIPLIPTELIVALLIWIFLIFLLKRLSLSGIIALTFLPFLALYFDRSITIIIGVAILIVSRWIINLINFNNLISGEDYKRLASRLKR